MLRGALDNCRTRAQRRSPYLRHWLGLAVIFLLLSVDEAVSFHELLSDFLEKTFNVSGFFYFAWIVHGTLFVAFVGGLYLHFLWNLPARTRYLMLAAGGIFLCGALGVEAVTARYVESNGFANLTYAGLATVEESLEMGSASLSLYALSYLRERTTEPNAHR